MPRPTTLIHVAHKTTGNYAYRSCVCVLKSKLSSCKQKDYLWLSRQSWSRKRKKKHQSSLLGLKSNSNNFNSNIFDKFLVKMFLHFSCLATRIPILRIMAADTVVTETHCSVQANGRIQGTANPNFITVGVKTPPAHLTHSWSWEKRDKRCLVPSLKHESSGKFKGKSKDFDKKNLKKSRAKYTAYPLPENK